MQTWYNVIFQRSHKINDCCNSGPLLHLLLQLIIINSQRKGQEELIFYRYFIEEQFFLLLHDIPFLNSKIRKFLLHK